MANILGAAREFLSRVTIRPPIRFWRRSSRSKACAIWIDINCNSCWRQALHATRSTARCGTWKRRLPTNMFGNWRTSLLSIKSRHRSQSVSILRIEWRRPQKPRSEEHTSELQSHHDLVCRLLLEKKKKKKKKNIQ